MAAKVVMACLLVAMLTQLASAQLCDPTEIQHGMTTCHMKLVSICNKTNDFCHMTNDFCIRYAEYKKCIDNLLVFCLYAPVTFTSSMQSATAAYSSQIEKCSSSGFSFYRVSSSGKEKASESAPQNSGTDNQALSCSASELLKKSASCEANFRMTVVRGDVCLAWQTYECCLKGSFTSCGSDMQSRISNMISITKTALNGFNHYPGLTECAAADCSSSAEVETTIMAIIQISDPRAFELDRYVEAVKKATRVAQLPKAAVKAFKILVKYVLPNRAMVISDVKAAIAKTSNVLDSQVQISQTGARRFGAGRRLGEPKKCEAFECMNIVDVTITVPDKSKAAAVQTSASDLGALESEIHEHISIANAPVTTAEVETKVKSTPSAADRLGSQIEHDVSDVDGTINAWWFAKDEGNIPRRSPSTTSSSSNVSIVLAALLILLPVL